MLVLLALWASLGRRRAFGVVPLLAWQAAGVALLLLAVLDAWRWQRGGHAAASPARVPDTWPIGVERAGHAEAGSARARSGSTCSTCIQAAGRMHGLPRRLQLARGEAASLDYRLRATARGDFRFDGVQLRLHSPWRLWWQSRVAGAAAARARVSELRAAGALCDVQRRTGLAPGRCAREAPPRRRHRLPPDARVPRRRQPAPDRLEGDRACAPPDLARIPGREEPAAGADARHRPAPARARRRAGAFRPRARCVAGGGLPRAAPGRRASACSPVAATPRWVPPQRGVGAIDNLLRASYALQPQAGGHRFPARRHRTARCASAAAPW